MSKAIGYIRVPAGKHSDSASDSAQNLILSAWCREQGIPLDAVHVELAEQPATPYGASMEAALKALSAGDVLVVDRLAFAAPNLSDWLGVCVRVEQIGASVVSVTDGFHTLPEGGAMVSRTLRALARLPRYSAAPDPEALLKRARGESGAPSLTVGRRTAGEYVKIYEQAGQLLRQGQHKKALDLWSAYLSHAEGENAACGWNCVGDIHDKQGQPEEAITHYQRAAQAFEEAGFPDRALAMLGKVRRIAPQRAEMLLHMARLHAHLERMGDAASCYLSYARGQVEAGCRELALNALNKMRVLDPVNVRFRLQLAAELHAMGFTREAVDDMLAAAELLRLNGQPHLAREQAEKAHALDPNGRAPRVFLEELDRAGTTRPVAVGAGEDFMTPDPTLLHPREQDWMA